MVVILALCLKGPIVRFNSWSGDLSLLISDNTLIGPMMIFLKGDVHKY